MLTTLSAADLMGPRRLAEAARPGRPPAVPDRPPVDLSVLAGLSIFSGARSDPP